MATDTTIRVTKDTKAKLEKLKVHKNQSFEEVILQLLEWKEAGEELVAAKKSRAKRK